MVPLKINRLRYEGEHYRFESPFLGSGVVIIEGDNGTGKTTFFNLLYYALGGAVSSFRRSEKNEWHKEIVEDVNNWVELDVTIGGESFFVRRLIGDSDILLTAYSEIDEKGELELSPVQVFPVTRGEGREYIFSDWLLEKLGVSIVEIFLGYRDFKINASDLMRLVYHDQSPDPEKVYKEPDSNNFVSDSALIRKVTFQLWMGKSFSDYYEAVSDLKRAEKEQSVAQAVLQEYELLAAEILGEREVRNVQHLQAEIQETEGQLERLQRSREALKKDLRREVFPEADFEHIRSELLRLELGISEVKESLVAALEEDAKLTELKRDVAKDLDRIGKILHTHEQLNLFSADTCPYCLSAVERVRGKCVCGSEVDEEQYERFFYSAMEYKALLKSKVKSLETIDFAREAVAEEISSSRQELKALQQESDSLRQDMQEGMRLEKGGEYGLAEINDLDDKILETRELIIEKERAIEVEAKLQQRQIAFDGARATAEATRNRVKKLDALANEEISLRVNQFSKYYNEFMQRALPDCRSARINPETYMPEINNREYREASARVPKRLMYFLTLLQMALAIEEVKYPGFLMVDTPETMGIETKWLVRAMEQIKRLENPLGLTYQIIMSTGLEKYPPEFEDQVIIRLRKDARLLQPRA